MNQRAITAVIAGIAPVIHEYVNGTMAKSIAVFGAQVEALTRRLDDLERREPLRGEQGPPGKDADVEPFVASLKQFTDDIKAAISDVVLATVEQKLAEIPLPKDGKDGRDGIDGIMGDQGVPGPQGNPGLDGKDGAPGRDGVDGKDGIDGKDGAPGLDGKDGADGIDGRDGRDGLPGVQGEKGIDGRDGTDGKDGRDGVGYDDLVEEFEDGGRIRVHKYVINGVCVREERFTTASVIHRGIYQPGVKYQRGDTVSWGGSTWHANEDTSDKPETTKAWQLAAKRGRDGKDGKPGEKGDKGERGLPGLNGRNF